MVASKQKQQKRPFGLLRVGFKYEKTLGMRRLTNTPIAVVLWEEGDLLILCRGEGLCFVRRLSFDDEDKGAFNLTGGGGPVGGGFNVDVPFVWPAAMIKDSRGRLWISDEGRDTISAITAEGEVKIQWGASGSKQGELNRPSGIAIDADGNLVVADAWNHRVQKFTEDGAFIAEWGGYGQGPGEFDMPWGICVDEEGFTYVCDWRNDRVQKLDPDGSHVMTIGESGSDDGQFNRPTGVTVDRDGDIYVADWANHRVQMFKLLRPVRRKVHRRRHVVGPGTRLHDHEHDGDEIARDDGDRTAKTLQMACVGDRGRRWPHVRARLWIAAYTDLPKRGHQARSGEIAPTPRSHSLYTQF